MTKNSTIPNRERVVNLAMALDASHRPLSAREIKNTDTIGYDPNLSDESFARALSRDISRLKSLGLIINTLPNNTYELDADASFAVDVSLTDKEATTLRVISETLSKDENFPYADDLRIVLVKLAETLDLDSSKEHQSQVDIQKNSAQPTSLDTNVYEKIQDALQNNTYLSFKYTDTKGNTTDRKIAVYGYYLRRNIWYVVGFDPLRNATRVFKVNRMDPKSVKALKSKHKYPRPNDFDINNFIGFPFEYGENAPCEVKLLIGAEDSWRAHSITKGKGTLEHNENGSLIWTIDSRNNKALLQWICGHEASIYPIKPHALVTMYSELLEHVVNNNAQKMEA